MAWPWSKKNGSDGDKPESDGITSEPAKAAAFFDRAATVHESGNFEYAMQLWLGGLKFDPGSMRGTQGFFRSADSFRGGASKKTPSKEVSKLITGGTPQEKYLRSLFEWAIQPTEALAAILAAESAAKYKLTEVCGWITERAAQLAVQQKIQKKDTFLRLSDCYHASNNFDRSLLMAEQALKLDPTDGALAAQIRNISAQATINKGGYQQAGQDGGYRQNIRDADKQRSLEDADRIVKTEDTVERLIQEAEAEHQRRPDDVPTIQKLCQRLLERARPADEERAYQLYTALYERLKEFRFRQAAGQIRVKQAQRRTSEAKRAVEAAPGDAAKAEALKAAQHAQVRLEIDELRIRIDAYPTDLALKYELGRRVFALGEWDDAIDLFQASQLDAKYKVPSLNMMAQCFHKKGWLDEAVATFRSAITANHDPSSETGLDLRYGLMAALQSYAEENKNLPAAEEADKLAGSIAIQQISYRDIRARRDAIKKLVQALRATG